MSCREHAREIYRIPQAFSENITTTGAVADIFQVREFAIAGFRMFMLYVNLPDGVAAAGGNLPVAIKAWGITDIGDVAGSRVMILEKCLTGYTNWSGKAFLEVNETHLGMNQGDVPFTHIYFSVDGPNTIVYETIVVLGNPDFQAKENVLEAFV